MKKLKWLALVLHCYQRGWGFECWQAWIFSGFLFTTAKVASITAMILFCLILHHTVPIHNFHIHLIEKTLSIERYKPWTVAPNKFMSRIFFSTANLKFFPEKYNYRSFSRRCIPKKFKWFPVFLAVSSQLHLCRAHQRSLRLKSLATSLTHTWKS